MKVVLYHKNCNDGLFAAYAAWDKFGKKAIYIPVNYKPIQEMTAEQALDYIFSEKSAQAVDHLGNSQYLVQDITKDKYQDIELFVVDYSFPPHHFLEHCALFKSVTILDHHKGAIEDYTAIWPHSLTEQGWFLLNPFDNAEIVFSKKDSGAKLAWRYFHPKKDVPGFIDLVSDRDLWQFKLHYTKPFHAGIRALDEQNFERLGKLSTIGLSRVIDIGMQFVRATNKRINTVSRTNSRPIFVYINGKEYTAVMVNSFADIASDLCSAVIKEHGCDIAISYNITTDLSVQCSIRSTNKTALVVARAFGGAGHDDASGFHMTLENLTNILTKGILEV